MIFKFSAPSGYSPLVTIFRADTLALLGSAASGAERRWERRQDRYDWRKENQNERWRRGRGQDIESDEQEEEEGDKRFRK